MKRMASVHLLGVAALFGACAPEPEVAARRFATVDPVCDPWGCGANSATLGDGIVFDELDLSGAPSSAGVSILSVSAPTGVGPAWIGVVGAELHVKDGAGADLAHSAALGTSIWLAGGGSLFELKLLEIDEIPFWAIPEVGIVETYRFGFRRWDEPQNKFHDICKATKEPRVLPGVTRHALVFQGDHYDTNLKTVQETMPGDTRFNISCMGTAPAKLHFLRHTAAGGLDGYTTSVDQRQAMLKMLVADYCGDGKPHTVDGQPLNYMDARRAYPEPPLDGSTLNSALIESVWKSSGALCLSRQRRPDFPAACTLRACDDGDLSAFATGHAGDVISAIPPPPSTM
jgi:hypothetical protein